MRVSNAPAVPAQMVTRKASDFIRRARAKYAPLARPLDRQQRLWVHPYFPPEILEQTRLLFLTGERVENPDFYPALKELGIDISSLPNFSTMAAITFVDVVVSHVPFSPRLLFHELVHATQYRQLGVPAFVAQYIDGFVREGSHERVPLEVHAYALDERFARNPGVPFSVEAEVSRWIAEDCS